MPEPSKLRAAPEREALRGRRSLAGIAVGVGHRTLDALFDGVGYTASASFFARMVSVRISTSELPTISAMPA